MVKTSGRGTIRNYLRAVAECNLELVAYFHGRYLSGELTEGEARRGAAAARLAQTIGKTGYVCTLAISVKTVGTHREKLKEKINLKTATELNRYATLWYNAGHGKDEGPR